VLLLLGVVFGVVLFVVVVGEWLGLFKRLTARVPWPHGVVVVLLACFPIFRNVLCASLRRQVTSHTLMSVGSVDVLAALAAACPRLACAGSGRAAAPGHADLGPRLHRDHRPLHPRPAVGLLIRLSPGLRAARLRCSARRLCHC